MAKSTNALGLKDAHEKTAWVCTEAVLTTDESVRAISAC
jgi:hypothetical protein